MTLPRLSIGLRFDPHGGRFFVQRFRKVMHFVGGVMGLVHVTVDATGFALQGSRCSDDCTLALLDWRSV